MIQEILQTLLNESFTVLPELPKKIEMSKFAYNKLIEEAGQIMTLWPSNTIQIKPKEEEEQSKVMTYMGIPIDVIQENGLSIIIIVK